MENYTSCEVQTSQLTDFSLVHLSLSSFVSLYKVVLSGSEST